MHFYLLSEFGVKLSMMLGGSTLCCCKDTFTHHAKVHIYESFEDWSGGNDLRMHLVNIMNMML
jgi:hypothetical protein